MIATKRQIKYIQTVEGVMGNVKGNTAIFALKHKLLHTERITLAGAWLGVEGKQDVYLMFACTKLGFKILNEAINLTLAQLSADPAFLLEHEHYSLAFLTPKSYKESGIKELEKCECIQLRVRTKDVASRAKFLSFFNKCAKNFI